MLQRRALLRQGNEACMSLLPPAGATHWSHWLLPLPPAGGGGGGGDAEAAVGGVTTSLQHAKSYELGGLASHWM